LSGINGQLGGFEMSETGESKRDQAARALSNLLDTTPYQHRDTIPLLVGLVIDAAKEEIRAELAGREEQAEERRWHRLKAMIDGPDAGPLPLGEEFWAEYWALKAKRKAAGKGTE
jgi:hypothetical protein